MKKDYTADIGIRIIE